MLVEPVLDRLAAVIKKGEAMVRSYALDEFGSPILDDRQYAEWRSQALALLTGVFDSGHTYTDVFRSQVGNTSKKYYVDIGLGILQAALEDVRAGYVETIRELAVAEVFSGFLEQADHLLQNGYSVPAVSLAGGVLENGLRSLATRSGIAVKDRDNLSSLNNKIGDKGLYSRLRQRQVASWIEVRNAAVHGRFDDFNEDDVAEVIKGVGNLLSSVA